VNEKLFKKMEQKIQDVVSDMQCLEDLSSLISTAGESQSFVFGIIVGRLYNSFFYQSKRILNREPTEQEIGEFLKFVESKRSFLENLR